MAAVSPTYLSGYVGTITVDSSTIAYMNGKVATSVGSWDATNASTGGAAFPERTIQSLKTTFDIPNVFAGTTNTITAGKVYAFTALRKSTYGYACNIYIDDVSEDFDPKGGSILHVSASSQGAITIT